MFFNLGTVVDIIKGAGNLIFNAKGIIDDINCTSLSEDDKKCKSINIIKEENNYIGEEIKEECKHEEKEVISITKDDFTINKFFMDRTRVIKRDENKNKIN